jgi:ketosteroid isomerase-like protein
MGIDEGLTVAIDRYEVAIDALMGGNPGPYTDCWARADDVTLYGAWGPVDKGFPTVLDTLRWVASRSIGGVKVELRVLVECGDFAYTVGLEHHTISVDGGPTHEMILRVTQIYRRIDGEWRVVHRHADILPPDQRKAPR